MGNALVQCVGTDSKIAYHLMSDILRPEKGKITVRLKIESIEWWALYVFQCKNWRTSLFIVTTQRSISLTKIVDLDSIKTNPNSTS